MDFGINQHKLINHEICFHTYILNLQNVYLTALHEDCATRNPISIGFQLN